MLRSKSAYNSTNSANSTKRHNRRANLRTPILKRQTLARNIDQCPTMASGIPPEFKWFHGSKCAEPSLQQYVIACSNEPPSLYEGIHSVMENNDEYTGQCKNNEICVNAEHQTTSWDNQFPTTYTVATCVTPLNKQRLAPARLTEEEQRVIIDLTEPNTESVEIVLTGQSKGNFDATVPFQASLITLTPRDDNNNRLGPTTTECFDCINLLMNNSVPAGTTNIDVTITLPRKGDIAWWSAYGWY